MLWILYTFIPTQNLVAKNLHIDFKILSEIVTIGVCFDGMARGRQSSSPRRQLINNNVIILERILKSMWKFLAKVYEENNEIRCDQDKILDNFPLLHIFCSNSPSHHNSQRRLKNSIDLLHTVSTFWYTNIFLIIQLLWYMNILCTTYIGTYIYTTLKIQAGETQKIFRLGKETVWLSFCTQYAKIWEILQLKKNVIASLIFFPQLCLKRIKPKIKIVLSFNRAVHKWHHLLRGRGICQKVILLHKPIK